MKFILGIAKIIKKFFYIFLDISGILLGVFLTWLGWWTVSGGTIPGWLGILILIIGVGAFIIHIGHYFSFKITKWLFGEDYFITKKDHD